MKRFVLIDGNAILHRAFHALPPLTTSSGELVNAVFGFTSMLLKVISELHPEYIAVTFDRPKPTFRKEIYVGYQAQRPEMVDELSSQIEKVHDVVKTLNIPIFEVDGYEADDVIGTLSKQAGKFGKKKNQLETIIVTGDRDLLQLIDDHVKVFAPIKGLSETILFDEKTVEEKFGLKPSQWIDFKALKGDSSDNYPGVAGIGPKTASDLLKKYDTLEKLYKHLSELPKKMAVKLKEGTEMATMAKQLATIVRDAPVKLKLDDCKVEDYDKEKAITLLKQLEFKSLISRLPGNSGWIDPDKPVKKTKEKDDSGQLSLL
jgi:DNA polymerase I